MRAKSWLIGSSALALVVCALPARADDLYKGGAFAALASDRRAEHLGDSLTVIVLENAQASNSQDRQASRSASLSGRIVTGSRTNAGQIALDGATSGGGATERSGRMAAQITVVVDAELPDGDLHVSGEQLLNINGERTHLKLKGRVRRADITSANTVLSSLLADATIDYGGSQGARDGRGGLASWLLGWAGVR